MTEGAAVLALVAGYAFILRDIQEFQFQTDGRWHLLATSIAFTPALASYAFLRILLPPLLSAALVGGALYLLSEASRIRMALTTDPLSWADVSSMSNLSVIVPYLTHGHLVFAVLGVLVIFAVAKIGRLKLSSGREAATAIAALAVLAPITLHPYFERERGAPAASAGFLQRAGVRYISWDWPQNVRSNSLPIHIVQTSTVSMPEAASDDERRMFLQLRGTPAAAVERPSRVIWVLCEACWHDGNNFRESFQELRDRGFRELRSISPVYGGGTVNAAFEILTGLPAGGPLNGVIYQEYATALSDSIPALPQAMRDAGYATISAHNHSRRFWKRNVVNPKLGFDRFLGLESMGYRGSSYWADDSVLFDSALREVRSARGPLFADLTTVHLHGGYRFDQDFGEGDYRRRLGKTIGELASFVDALLKDHPDSLIVVYADHKPALTRYFAERGVFSPGDFSATGERNEDFQFSDRVSLSRRGDVPVYVYHRDNARISNLAQAADSKPFYCLSMYVNREFTQVSVPAHEFSSRRRICDEFQPADYEGSVAKFPDWLYWSMLFEAHRPAVGTAKSALETGQ